MFKTMTSKLAVLAVISVPGSAFAAATIGDAAGTTAEGVRDWLIGQGYTVEEIELEGNEIEAEVSLDGVMLEIEVDATTGLIAEMELEDDDDDDEDEDDDDEDEDYEDDDSDEDDEDEDDDDEDDD